MDAEIRTFISLFVWDKTSARINMRGHAYILPLEECVELRTALDDAIEEIEIRAAQHYMQATGGPQAPDNSSESQATSA